MDLCHTVFDFDLKLDLDPAIVRAPKYQYVIYGVGD